ncbi:hypothetical protein TNCV_4066311 [Trichonephila clavipes]|uniref:Reverse transcriptase domain-containing protein n=1 Tax=Trichonephila clavipes TaxID=2585209 RepID=A0A8X6W9S4_TRICX|nr:hypothetical protein TNCV_4066311 [Trichonephila clavipes]
MVYMDDLITSPSFNEHIDHLNQVFTLLRDAELTLNKDKCHFARDKYLGLIISKEGIQTDNTKQREDPQLGHIYRYLENPDDGSVNVTVCEGWSQDFKLIDGLLFYAKYSRTLGELRVYIPKSLREAIMQ